MLALCSVFLFGRLLLLLTNNHDVFHVRCPIQLFIHDDHELLDTFVLHQYKKEATLFCLGTLLGSKRMLNSLIYQTPQL